MRKLIVAAVTCLAVGVSGAAYARGGGGGHSGGGSGSRSDGAGNGGNGGGGGTLFIPGGGGGSAAGHATASSKPAGGAHPHVGSQQDSTFGTTTIGNTGGIGTETIDGQTFVGTTQGQSGSTSGLAPVFAGRNVNVLLGPDKGTTSKREACPGWMQTSGLDTCIRPQDQIRPQDVRR